MDPISPISPMNSMPPQAAPQSNSKIWVVIAIIVVLLIAAFVLYYRGALQDERVVPMMGTSGSVSAAAALRTQGTSDDISAIEADLRSTNLNNLTNEASAIDQELSAPVTP